MLLILLQWRIQDFSLAYTNPPGTRYSPGPGTPPDQVHPPADHAGIYSQHAGSMLPTGMQSCSMSLSFHKKESILLRTTSLQHMQSAPITISIGGSGGSKGGARDMHPLGVQILSISCIFWENLANRMLVPPRELVPPPWGNLGSVCSGGWSAPGDVYSEGGCLLPGGVRYCPPVNRITDACKNITLPQLRCGR